MSFSPASGEYAIGSTISVGLYVGSMEFAVNAASGVISYPQDKLEVVGVSKNQSIISLWVQEPSFSNSAGTVNFEGIILNPGFKGAQGKLVTVNFKVKAQGTAIVSLTASSLLANDGEGTNIKATTNSASYTLSLGTPAAPRSADLVPSPPDIKVPKGVPLAKSEITSNTHPSEKWSSATTGLFMFGLEANVSAVRLLLDQNTATLPTVVYSPAIQEKEITDIQEGTSYLHLQAKDSSGWGEVFHYKIQVDTKSPEDFKVTEVAPYTFVFNAQDDLSGVFTYEIQVDSLEPVTIPDDGSHVFKIPPQNEGDHTLTVTAVDRAGNTKKVESIFKSVPVLAVPTEKETVIVTQIREKGEFIITILSVLIPFVALVILLGGLLYVTWRALGGLRTHVATEVAEAKVTVQKAFSLLRDDLREDIVTLQNASKKRKLTTAEAKILKRLQQNIDEAETVIRTEIEDI